ncbi:MAG: CocE/NonD family hydrolase [Planctomycetes bacterium]|nr:CocE/NonD family hydrolase [Planctomycetota bacterium]
MRALYTKREVLIPMRDGVRLHTAIYTPRESRTPFPILLRRTPYSCRPYGAEAFPETPGPNDLFTGAGYAFAIQDVRGAYLSEGEFVDMRPHVPVKDSAADVDESTDAYDTIDWLVANVAGNNGRVGMWGISYPGFYAAAGMIDAHPALKAVSPQAPIADWWFDDFHHHGALFLPHAFLFLDSFGRPRPRPTTERGRRRDWGSADGYSFFLRAGVADLGREHFGGEVRFWDELMAHPEYDAFWQARNLLPHLERVAPAVLTVGGWYDAEDLYGPLKIYEHVERGNPEVWNALVMGPWAHGGWARSDGDALGQARFGEQTAAFFRNEIEKPFFDHHLLGAIDPELPEAYAFDTGANAWERFDAWPPRDSAPRVLALGADGALSLAQAAPVGGEIARFVSDPAKPVPHTSAITLGMNREYMTEDQRFAARRPDVAVFTSPPLEQDVALVGPLRAMLRVSTDATDADWIVKLVDVHPDAAPDPTDPPLVAGQRMGGYQRLVRGEVMPGRFRRGYERAVPHEPGVVDEVAFELWDVLHTFRRGHRIQVQVQSTWFPLVAANPQVFLPNPWESQPADRRAATHTIHAGSRLEISVLEAR